MRLLIKARKIQITPEEKEYLIKKLKKYKKQLPETAVADVEFRAELKSRHGRNRILNLTMDIPGYKIIHLAKAATTFNQAIDLIQPKLRKQIEKYQRKKNRKAGRIGRTVGAMKKMLLWFPEKITFGRLGRGRKVSPIIYRESIEIEKPMTEAEALEEIKISKQNVLVFQNACDNKICVLYRKKRKKYGIMTIE